MTNAQAPVFPPALRESSLLAHLGRIGEIDLASYRENLFVAERLEQRLEKIRLHAHVAVEQYNDVVARRAKAGVGASAEA